ncbi:MAG: DUF952 domain-containing protein [Lysobacterales bacterium]
MSSIFRITSLSDWQVALATGVLPRCAADRRDDCVHVNAADDSAQVASAFFSADEQPLALELDQLALAPKVTWLPPTLAKPWRQGRAAIPNILVAQVLAARALLPVNSESGEGFVLARQAASHPLQPTRPDAPRPPTRLL